MSTTLSCERWKFVQIVNSEKNNQSGPNFGLEFSQHCLESDSQRITKMPLEMGIHLENFQQSTFRQKKDIFIHSKDVIL
jgi:hypothetical protein